jgi:kinesin family protein 15
MSSNGLFDDAANGNNGSTSIKVIVRVRPLSDREKSCGSSECVRVQGTDTVVLGSKDGKGFSFDFVADTATSQSKVFELTGRPVVDACISGYNATIFAYGQTGSGKTFTMSGSGDAWGSSNELRGLIPRVMEHMFERIAAAKASDSTLECAVRASYLEVYNETLADLLDASGGQVGVGGVRCTFAASRKSVLMLTLTRSPS